MKTQINHLINGSKEVVRDESHPKYMTASKSTSHIGYAGSSHDERMLIAEKVFSENVEALQIEIRGIRLSLNLHQSLSGATKWYRCEVTEEEYLNITGFLMPPFREGMQKKYGLVVNPDMTVDMIPFRRWNESQEWKPGNTVSIGEEFVTIL